MAQRAADAIARLDRQDLLAKLVDVLTQPDPRLPIKKAGDGDGYVVRELVRVIHHHNCLLCHAPGNTAEVPTGVLRVGMPLPTEPLPPPAQYYSTIPSPDIVVRIDRTYLRQDFSMMMPVSDAQPWPKMQRFDFLVRTREITPTEAKTYVEDREPG